MDDHTLQASYSKEKRKRAFGIAATVTSGIATTVVPIMAIPTAFAAYKTYKYNKTKRALEASHPELTETSATESFNSNVRQVTRHFSRGSIGLIFASAMTPVLPHFLLPAGVNVYILHRAEKDRKQLESQMHKHGFRVRKRDVARGVSQVVLEKAILIPITLGHDDLLLAFPSTALNDAGFLHKGLLEAGPIGAINDAINAPVEMVQEALDIETSGDRLEAVQNYDIDSGGWHQDVPVVALNVTIGGSTAAAVDCFVDRPLEYKDGKLHMIPEEKKQ